VKLCENVCSRRRQTRSFSLLLPFSCMCIYHGDQLLLTDKRRETHGNRTRRNVRVGEKEKNYPRTSWARTAYGPMTRYNE